ncbi:MAG TPA: type II toxin-antitoxin system VapC family toxin [Rhizomicrobium sp.]|nr:type II toxin-antitoxin system VapC family toxin [Rhizomicrobium sp.]
MSAVVDSSVLVAALVDTGSDGNWAEEIVAGGALHAPELARAETANILRRLELANRITASVAEAAYGDLLALALDTYPFDPFADRIWTLRRTVTAYDAWYVALAEALDVPLATLDGRLRRASGTRCRFLAP